jgi:micrococcal nuclease
MYRYQAKVTRVIDGDTLDVDIDLGFHVHVKEKIRLLDVNTPEIFGAKSADPTERERGHQAKQLVEQWVAQNPTVILTSFDSKKLSQEKYGRWLAVVQPVDGQLSLNEVLQNAGYGA